MDEAELVAVFTGSPRDAEMLRAALAGSDIEAVIQSSGIGGAYPVNVGDLAKTMLLVRTDDADAARDLINAGDSHMLDPEPPEAPARHRVALIVLATVIVIALVAGFVAAELRSLIP